MITLNELINHIVSNQFATGLASTAILGGVMYQLKSVPKVLWDAFVYSTTIQMSVNNKDDSFTWIDRWLSSQPYAKRTRNTTLRTVTDGNDRFVEGTNQSWIVTPGEGRHWFFWKRRLVYVIREGQKTKKKVAGSNSISPREMKDESLSFRIWGRHQDIIRSLVEEAKLLQNTSNMVMVKLWTDGWWKAIRGKTPRKLESIVLQPGQLDRIVEDIKRFQEAGDWYHHRGIPYRRGYLFTGKPGTGKTSVVFAIAGHFRRPIYVINLGSVADDNALFEAITDAPVDAIILLEDIDCARASQSREGPKKDAGDDEDDEKEPGSKVTKAGLLNALDGITTPDGRIFIMTTNYVDNLDPALIRPGRADVHEEFQYLSKPEQELMAERFYGPGKFRPFEFTAISPALMQSAFSRFPEDPVAAKQFLHDETRKLQVVEAA
jgi:mitochondrial chaperone BCS1